MRLVAAVAMSLFVVTVITNPAYGQQFSAAFASELSFQPVPLLLSSTEFTMLMAVTVADTTFASQTQFDLTAFKSQLFSLELALGELALTDRLLFQPALTFERNELLASLEMNGFHLAVEALLEELGPPSPDVNPGLVVEAGGRSAIGIGLRSSTGFAVAQVAEDLITVLPCSPIELGCLGGTFPDDHSDRLVVKPFVFSEQAVRVDLTLGSITLAATPIFTITGLSRLLLEATLQLEENLRFTSLSTLDPALALTRQAVLFEASLGPLSWRALTLLSGPPIVFEAQTFKTRLSLSGFDVFTTVIFDALGLSELRLGAGFSF